MVYIQRTNVTVLQRFPVCFKKVVNSAAEVVFAAGQREFRLRRLSSVCVCVCACVLSAATIWHINTMWNTFSPASTEIYSKSCYSLSKKCSRFVFSVLFESLHSKATSLISPIIPILSFHTQKRKKDLYSVCLSQSCLSYSLPSVCSLCLGQMAVSHTTACGLWQGGVPVLRGSGVFLQLGKIGILSCLHKLLSGRR